MTARVVTVLLVSAASFSGTAWRHRGPTVTKPPTLLAFSVNRTGLTTLKYAGQELLARTAFPSITRANFERADGTTYVGTVQPTTVSISSANTILQVLPWGAVKTEYTQAQGKLTCVITVWNNTVDKLKEFELELAELDFKEVPTLRVYEKGMWGAGEGTYPAPGWTTWAGGPETPSAMCLGTTKFVMNFCLVPYAETDWTEVYPGAANETNRKRLRIWIDNIKAAETRTTSASLRFYPVGSKMLGETDVSAGFRSAYPLTVESRDNRPIGAIILASNGVTTPTNPSRWIEPWGPIDVTTPEGLAKFQEGVLQLARNSVANIQKAGGQGVIVWDIEGQRIGDTYYGDPRRMGEIAPEMESLVGGQMPLADAFFKVFRDAGLKVGVCVRPQKLYLSADGYWVQQDVNSQEGYDDLKASMAYAINRWGVSMFYVDSSARKDGPPWPLEPWVFEQLSRDFPGVLFAPENQSFRYYATTKPFDSFYHHTTQRTNPDTREVWPQAASVIYAPAGTLMNGETSISDAERAARRAMFIDGVRRGDILLFNCWYGSAGSDEIAEIYRSAMQ